MLNIWDIKRSDKRDRCMDCLKPFRKGQIKKKCASVVYRFPNKCYACFYKNKVI